MEQSSTMARGKNTAGSNFFSLPFQMKESFKVNKNPSIPRSSSGSTSFTEFGDQETELDSMRYQEYEEDSFDEELRFSVGDTQLEDFTKKLKLITDNMEKLVETFLKDQGSRNTPLSVVANNNRLQRAKVLILGI